MFRARESSVDNRDLVTGGFRLKPGLFQPLHLHLGVGAAQHVAFSLKWQLHSRSIWAHHCLVTCSPDVSLRTGVLQWPQASPALGGSLSCGEEFPNELSNPVTMGLWGTPSRGAIRGSFQEEVALEKSLGTFWVALGGSNPWPGDAGPRGLAPPAPRRRGVCFGFFFPDAQASLVAQLVKYLPAVQETWVQLLGWEDPPEKGTATHSSVLAWRAGYD